MQPDLSKHAYRTLGRSGLIVSPLALGTMPFGKERWGSDAAASLEIFNTYVDAGGNFFDTAETYSEGRSEDMLGTFMAGRKLREQLVIATKFGWAGKQGPSTGGNSRRNMHRALEGSLKRLKTDWIDLYWLHVWDRVTPAEEVLQTMNDFIRAGKIRYFGLSNAPAWYAAKMATLAGAHGLAGPVALQLEYSPVERSIENEHIPAAAEFGMAVQPWSALAGGFLTGKYERGDPKAAQGRLSGANPFGDTKFTDRNWAILDTIKTVAQETGQTPARISLAWSLRRAHIVAPITAARDAAQLRETLDSCDFHLSDQHLRILNEVSAPVPVNPYFINQDAIGRMVFGAEIR